MDLFTLKLVATPILMLFVSLAVKKWGSFVGGILSGLPLTSGPVAIFLSLEQGPAFAAQSACAALSGLAAVLAAYLGYLFLSRRLSIWATCLSALIIFACSSAILMFISALPLTIVISLIIILAIIYFTRNLPSDISKTATSFWDIPLRMLTATMLLFAITSSAHAIGPQLSGLLSPVPVIAWPLTVFAHRHGGSKEMMRLVRGNAVSAVGVILFYLIISGLILRIGILTTFVMAFMASICVTVLLTRVLRFTETTDLQL